MSQSRALSADTKQNILSRISFFVNFLNFFLDNSFHYQRKSILEKPQNKEYDFFQKLADSKNFYDEPKATKTNYKPENNKVKYFNLDGIFLLEHIGEGGFGKVSKIYDKNKNKFIAIKVVNSEHTPFELILLEHTILTEVEKIRIDISRVTNNQPFLQYYGLSKTPNILNLSKIKEKIKKLFVFEFESGIGSLEDILKAGKQYSCKELIYVLKILVSGYEYLQKNRIANRDVKPANIILIEDPSKENQFLYKISDFGTSYLLDPNSDFLNRNEIKAFTLPFSAPEIRDFLKNPQDNSNDNNKGPNYNPFKADVYSLGLVALKMINNSWGKRDFRQNILSKAEAFKQFEPVANILKNMLRKKIEKRWDFIQLKIILDKIDIQETPTDELKYYYIHLEKNEMRKIGTKQGLQELYNEEMYLFYIYDFHLARSNQAKFHIEKAWRFFQELKPMLSKGNAHQDKTILKKEISMLCSIANLYQQRRDFDKVEGFLQQAMKLAGGCKENSKIYIEIFEILGKLNMAKNNYKEAEKFLLKGIQILEKNEEDERILSSYANLGVVYEGQGNFTKTSEVLMKTFQISQKLYGRYHKINAGVMNNLGILHYKKGDYSTSEKYYLQSLEITDKVYGEVHQLSAIIYINLGNIKMEKNDIPKAKEYFLKSQEIMIKVNGGDDYLNELDIIYINLGKVSHAEKDFKKSEEYFLKALKIKEQNFTELDPDTAKLCLNLGGSNFMKVNYKKAIEFYKKSLNIFLNTELEKNIIFTREKKIIYMYLGKIANFLKNLKKAESFYLRLLKINQIGDQNNASDDFSCYKDLGEIYEDLKDFQKAESFYDKFAQFHINNNNESNLDVANNYNNLGNLYKSTLKYKKAKSNYLKSLNIKKNLNDQNTFPIAETYNNLGMLHEKLWKPQKAEKYYLKSLQIRLQLYGENHENTFKVFRNLGILYENLSNFPKAEEFFRKCLKIKIALNGPDHHETATSYIDLAMYFKNIKSLKFAEENYSKALKIFVNLYGEMHAETSNVYLKLGNLFFFASNEINKSEEFYEKCLKIRLVIYGDNSVEVSECFNNLGNIMNSRRNYSKAEELYTKGLKIMENVYGLNNFDVAALYGNLGHLYAKTRNFSKAEQSYLKSLQIMKVLYGERHPQVLSMYQMLLNLYKHLGNLPKVEDCQNKILGL